jgi:hypothetical protein
MRGTDALPGDLALRHGGYRRRNDWHQGMSAVVIADHDSLRACAHSRDGCNAALVLLTNSAKGAPLPTAIARLLGLKWQRFSHWSGKVLPRSRF